MRGVHRAAEDSPLASALADDGSACLSRLRQCGHAERRTLLLVLRVLTMGRVINRKPSTDTLYPVDLPNHVWVRHDRPATLYFTMKQLTELRAAVAAAIVKANKHRMESK